MNDLIRRQDAIDVISAYLGIASVSNTVANMTTIRDILESLPSAQPERKKGMWSKVDVATYRCDSCGKVVYADDSNELNYCSNCGADAKANL